MLEAYAASGLSIAAFIRQHGLSRSRFEYWRRRLTEMEQRAVTAAPEAAPVGASEAAPTALIGSNAPARSTAPTRMVRARVVESNSPPTPEAKRAAQDGDERAVEVALRGGARLTFRGSWDSAALAPWMQALEALS